MKWTHSSCISITPLLFCTYCIFWESVHTTWSFVPNPGKHWGVKHRGYYLSSFHFWTEIYNYCCCVSSCLQTFLYLSHCGQQKWHSQGEVMTSFACKNPGGKNRWIKYCFHISLACLWGKVHLGLAGGHIVLMAQGWQSCLADKGIIHIALSL